MIEIESTQTIDPLCPHCETVQQRLLVRSVRSTLGRRYVYFCSSCRKILGVSHRKGFFMG